MSNVFQPGMELSRDLEDCRQLAPFVLDQVADTHIDITYAPLKKFQLNPHAHKFLRMFSKNSGGMDYASLELIELDTISGSQLTIMGVAVTEGSEIVDTQEADTTYLGDPTLEWPTLLMAPQIDRCMHNFRQGNSEFDVEADELLAELMGAKDITGRQPHIKIRQARDLDIQDYSVSLLQREHSMPDNLAGSLNSKLSRGEVIQLIAEYQGEKVLDATVLFTGKRKLTHLVGGRDDSAMKHIHALASFKRAVFDYI